MKTRKIALYILLSLISLWMVVIGGFKVLAADPFLSNMKALHYSTGFTIFLGIVEVLGGIGIWIPRFRNYALVGLLLIMPGAIAAHISSGQPLDTIGGAVICAVLLITTLYLNSAAQLKAFLNNKLITTADPIAVESQSLMPQNTQTSPVP